MILIQFLFTGLDAELVLDDEGFGDKTCLGVIVDLIRFRLNGNSKNGNEFSD